MKRLCLLILFMVSLPLNGLANSLSLSPQLQRELAAIAPGTTLTPALAEALREIAFDQNRSLDERIEAMQKAVGFTPSQPLKRRVCIWDIAGRAGPIFQAAQDQQVRLQSYGVELELVPYTSESVLVDELQGGRCDAGLMSGLRARLFNQYTGTIDAIGALPSDEHMRTLLQVLAHPGSADRMVSNSYVILGIAPAGPAYIFVNDRAINTLGAAAGRRVAVLDYDEVQAEMVSQIGATPVPTDIVNAPNRFNNGTVDVLAAPLVAYEILELYRGMTPNGGIIRYPLAQISMQLIGRADRFPNEIAQLVREEFFNNYDYIMERLEAEYARVDDKWWIEIPEKDKLEYEELMREARITLRDQDYYSADMLNLQRRIRCRKDAARAECADGAE